MQSTVSTVGDRAIACVKSKLRRQRLNPRFGLGRICSQVLFLVERISLRNEHLLNRIPLSYPKEAIE